MDILQPKTASRLSLTLPYLCGLTLILIVMTTTLFLFMRQVSSSENDAFIINISGKQRMLSQRIAFMAQEIYLSTSTKEANHHAVKMANAIEEMFNNHQSLSYGVFKNGITYELSPDLRSLYYANNGLDQKVDGYIKLAEQYLFTYINDGLEKVQTSDLMNQIATLATDSLLNDLDRAVTQYETEARQNIDNLQRIKILFFALGVMIILLEIILIFSPMVTKILKHQKALASTNLELTEFTYRISHDLRSPIVSSMGLVNTALESLTSNELERTRKALEHIKVSMANLEKLTEDVIELTKMKVKEVPEEEIHLDYMIDLAIRSVENLTHFPCVDIQTDIKTNDPIIVKKLLLQQVLENLISNGIKYCDLSKEHPFVKISVDTQRQNIILTITDNGIGIPRDYQDKVFKMFQRFHPKVSFGSGLGLYLVHQNVLAMGGRIYYYGLPDGTEFKIILPIKQQKGEHL